MAGFKEIRQQLDESRNAQSGDYSIFLKSREHHKKIKKQREQLERKVSGTSNDREELNRLKEEENRAAANFNHHKNSFQDRKIISSGLYAEFERLSDPRQQIKNLNDAFPFLLFPVRIETRFKKVMVRETTTDQLWVRIYPDDCLIDSFEEMLSETEIKNAIQYWNQTWEAGGNIDLEKGAW